MNSTIRAVKNNKNKHIKTYLQGYNAVDSTCSGMSGSWDIEIQSTNLMGGFSSCVSQIMYLPRLSMILLFKDTTVFSKHGS